ncbi:hypothetical protein KP509_38G045000 [Ceratopteris richardii]|uniref:Uncharacterized protein n=1 Tax=Ceratopteris richardii TaxID=49495 RepID=A0A8T2Q444_CERRI|nr:hypothetical protein KP509_38G045000 [Ceratopteris richardii]
MLSPRLNPVLLRLDSGIIASLYLVVMTNRHGAHMLYLPFMNLAMCLILFNTGISYVVLAFYELGHVLDLIQYRNLSTMIMCCMSMQDRNLSYIAKKAGYVV